MSHKANVVYIKVKSNEENGCNRTVFRREAESTDSHIRTSRLSKKSLWLNNSFRKGNWDRRDEDKSELNEEKSARKK